ncbi:MAG TPA: SufS family cysteine desulfurase [Gemmatimonadales bacterium]|jgi:cysteine desulfurase/selenocysteine lyase
MTAPPTSLPKTDALDVAAIRSQFPILGTLSRGKPLVYLDNAATTQKPLAMIDAVRDFYLRDNANIHRGVYQLSERATLAWDAARERVARFIGAGAADEVVFVRGTTEAINLVAHSFLRPRLARNPTVVVTAMEHHANIVPWQLVGATTTAIPISDSGELDLAAAERVLRQGAGLLAVAHISNALGTINPVADLCRMARAAGVPILIDGAQAAAHVPIDVAELGCDFYCFSGHKVFGPTGIGALWAKPEHLAAMPPYQGGGDMIDEVSFEHTTFADPPRRFEAGTPDIAGAVGLDAALGWLATQDRDAIRRHENGLRDYATERLSEIPGLQLVGTAPDKAAVIAFVMRGAHPHDIASLLDGDGICVRAGHHCTQPLHRRLGLSATARASFTLYNTRAEVDALAQGLLGVRRVLGL